jgi:hypothetical protein
VTFRAFKIVLGQSPRKFVKYFYIEFWHIIDAVLRQLRRTARSAFIFVILLNLQPSIMTAYANVALLVQGLDLISNCFRDIFKERWKEFSGTSWNDSETGKITTLFF